MVTSMMEKLPPQGWPEKSRECETFGTFGPETFGTCSTTFKILLSLFLLSAPLFAQPVAPPSDVSAVIAQFQAATAPWLAVGEQVATSLFGLLAVIEFAITFGMLIFSHADITMWGATLLRKFMTVGAFYALLLLGPTLMQAIIDSYVKFGSMASGVPNITASNILADGIDIIATLLASAVGAGILLSIPTALLLVLCAAVIGWGFIKLVKGFVMAKIESFITIYAAVIQLGWGASRFTSIYAERYVAAAMATGIKLMVFYFIVGVERALAPAWIAAAQQAPFGFAGIVPALTLTMSIVLFCSLADPEKLTANIFAGQPQFTGHDITNSYMPYVNSGIGMATSSVGLVAGLVSGGALAPLAAGAFAGAGSGAGRTATTAIATAGQVFGGNRPQSTPPPRGLPPASS